MGKNVCLNFFQSGWWSSDALGCHLIGICRGIGDSLKYHYKYWNKSCCRNESNQTSFCARMSTPNSLWRTLGQHYHGEKRLCDRGHKHLCEDDERQTRGLLFLYSSCPFVCIMCPCLIVSIRLISLGCMCYFYSRWES